MWGGRQASSYVNNFALHTTLKLIASDKLTFDAGAAGVVVPVAGHPPPVTHTPCVWAAGVIVPVAGDPPPVRLGRGASAEHLLRILVYLVVYDSG